MFSANVRFSMTLSTTIEKMAPLKSESRMAYMQFLVGRDAVQFAKERLAEYKSERS